MMTVAALREPATSTEDRAERQAERNVATATTQVATAPTGKLCAEKLNLVVFTGKVIGWVFEFLSTTTPRGVGIHAQAPQQHSSNAAKRIAALWEDVDAMARLHPNWNGYGSEPPNELARTIAKQILLSATTSIVPNRVAPSAQGGVGICFYGNGKYGDMECLNTGEIFATTSDGRSLPDVWEVKPSDSKGALERIGRFINS